MQQVKTGKYTLTLTDNGVQVSRGGKKLNRDFSCDGLLLELLKYTITLNNNMNELSTMYSDRIEKLERKIAMGN